MWAPVGSGAGGGQSNVLAHGGFSNYIYFIIILLYLSPLCIRSSYSSGTALYVFFHERSITQRKRRIQTQQQKLSHNYS